MATGQQAPVLWVALGLIVALPLIVLALAGFPVTFEFPESGRFNIRGGIEVLPEFMALLFGLTIYTAAFIAEVMTSMVSGGKDAFEKSFMRSNPAELLRASREVRPSPIGP